MSLQANNPELMSLQGAIMQLNAFDLLRSLPKDASEELKEMVLNHQEKREIYLTTHGDEYQPYFAKDLDNIMSKYYYIEVAPNGRTFPAFQLGQGNCHFCNKNTKIGSNGKYRTIQEVLELKGACVDCQYKLGKKEFKCCRDRIFREERDTYMIDCQFCSQY
jgi:hypothetical protein